VLALDARQVGIAAWRLGAGRSKKSDAVQAAAGVIWHATVGDEVIAGQPLFELHTDDAARLDPAEQAVTGAAVIGDGPAAERVLVSRMIGPT
jgi:thymidine phosphorylase